MDRILIVEDDRNTLEGLAEILSMENYHVTKAIDGHTARKELKNGSFNIMLTDLLLPDVDGLELANQAWQEQAELMVVMMTAFGSVKHAVSAMNGNQRKPPGELIVSDAPRKNCQRSG